MFLDIDYTGNLHPMRLPALGLDPREYSPNMERSEYPIHFNKFKKLSFTLKLLNWTPNKQRKLY
jgi:hypothetical protein